MTAAIAKAFTLQAGWCQALGSPFMAALMARCADAMQRPGPLRDLLADWPGEPLADALAIRVAGALHHAVLTGADPALAAEYPQARADWSLDRVWPRVEARLARDPAAFRAFIASAPQTNETRRTIALLPGFLACAARGPLHLLEIGASAGLNQIWDRFRFVADGWAYGPADGPEITTTWRGPPPAHRDAPVAIAGRAGCDVAPIDIADPAQRQRLRAYLWPDQPERMARLDAAMAAVGALKLGPPERADAGAWLAKRLAAPLPEGVTVIFHSVVWQYLPPATKAAVEAAIAEAAARASEARRLAWLRFEPNPMLLSDGPKEGMGVDLTLWPGGARRRLCDVDGHAVRVGYLG